MMKGEIMSKDEIKISSQKPLTEKDALKQAIEILTDISERIAIEALPEKIKQMKEVLVDTTCTCDYLLPSHMPGLLNPENHPKECPYHLLFDDWKC